MTARALTVSTMAATAICALAWRVAEARLHRPEPKTTVWGAVIDLTPSDEPESFVRGAHKAVPTDWPASLYPKTGDGDCSATLVGPEVLLTAAHCVDNGSTASFKLKGAPHTAICSQAESYANKTDISADYALCRVSPAVAGIRFERVNGAQSLLTDGLEVLLTGFGCTKDNGTGGNDGNYWIGTSNISEAPSKSTNGFRTSGGAALCFGDSGAAAFVQQDGDRRIVIAVNSEIEPGAGGGLGDTSRLGSVSSPAALAFFAKWSYAQGKPKFCGYNTQARDPSCHI